MICHRSIQHGAHFNTSRHPPPDKGLASTKEHTSPAAGKVTDEGMFRGTQPSVGEGRMRGGCGRTATQQQTAISLYCCLQGSSTILKGHFIKSKKKNNNKTLMTTREKCLHRPSPFQHISISSLMFLLVKGKKNTIL